MLNPANRPIAEHGVSPARPTGTAPCGPPTSAGNPVIEIPVRILWGALDRALSADLAELSLRYCKRGELTMFPDATHWLQHEEHDSVSRALAEFFLPAPENQGLRDKA